MTYALNMSLRLWIEYNGRYHMQGDEELFRYMSPVRIPVKKEKETSFFSDIQIKIVEHIC